MKKLILMILLAQGTAALSQKGDVPLGVRLSPPADVPSIVRERFREEFPKVNASWQNVADEGFVATFQDDSTQLPRRVLYSSTGQKIESHARVESGMYPAAIDEHFHRTAPTVKFLVWRHAATGAEPGYYAVTSADTSWFGSKGDYLSAGNHRKTPQQDKKQDQRTGR